MLKVRYTVDNALEAGIDEAGRGCLWGPLYAAAVFWPPEEEWIEEHREIGPLIKDSKKLSAKKRTYLAEQIKCLAMDYGIGIVQPEEIDSLGMTQSNQLAFGRALNNCSIQPDRALIDGILDLGPHQEVNNIKECFTIVEGDGKYLPIAAASIVAKEARDSYVLEQVEKNPLLQEHYSIGSSKGYGTEKHRKGILDHGVHAQHRRLFLRKLLNPIIKKQEEECLITDD